MLIKTLLGKKIRIYDFFSQKVITLIDNVAAVRLNKLKGIHKIDLMEKTLKNSLNHWREQDCKDR